MRLSEYLPTAAQMAQRLADAGLIEDHEIDELAGCELSLTLRAARDLGDLVPTAINFRRPDGTLIATFGDRQGLPAL